MDDLEWWQKTPMRVDVVAGLARHATKKYKTRKLSSIKRIVLHTTDWEVSPADLAKYDVGPNHISTTGCPAITYHEMVTESGNTAFYTLPWEEVSWHVGVWNPGSLAVALVYRCTDKNEVDSMAPFPAGLEALQVHCGNICLKLGLTPDKVVGHRELKGTGWTLFKGSRRLRKTCPGIKVDLDLFRVNVAKYMQIKLKSANLYVAEPVDGDFGKKSRAAFDLWRTRGFK